jgi:hypothetical protein
MLSLPTVAIPKESDLPASQVIVFHNESKVLVCLLCHGAIGLDALFKHYLSRYSFPLSRLE